MDKLHEAWNGKFGPEVKLPEWVSNFSVQDVCEQDVERKIAESEVRIGKLREEIEKELFLLTWLKGVRECGPVTAPSLGLSETTESEEENHVLGDTDQVFEEKEALNHPIEVPRLSVITGKSPVGTPDRVCGKSLATSCEDSPSSSEYHTAGQGSSSEEVSQTNLAEEATPTTLARDVRERSIDRVTFKDSLVAKGVRQRLTEDRLHRSCEVLSESNKGDYSPSHARKHRRNSSAPTFVLDAPPQGNQTSKEDPVSRDPCSDSDATGVGSKQTEPSPLTNGTDTTFRVVLREKVSRRPSLPMSCEEAMNRWKGTGGVSSERADRSSNGMLDSCEGYAFMVNNDEDSDPALINVMASRMRGAHRTSRSSVSTDDSPTSLGRTSDLVSPVEDPSHTPVPGAEAAGVSAKHTAPLRKRSGTYDTSPIKRDRFSYHYSDDECLTPKLDSGDHSTFSNSPNSSNRCSHRNSRSSNGIIDEEGAYDLTLRKDKSDVPYKLERKKTITPDSPAESRALALSGDVVDDRQLTSTLTPHIGYAAVSHNELDERVDSFSELEGLKLGDLDIDVDLTLSKLRNKPEMSMATLLDMNENIEMNAQLPSREFSLSEDLEYGIDEATISAVTVSNEMYGSRSNSANSIPGLFSEQSGMSPPEQESPTHSAHQGVNLRQSGGVKRSHRKRMGNLDLEMMTGGQSSDNDNLSRSSASLTSEEESTSPGMMDDNLSPGSRTSRLLLFPVRSSTVVVHGEQLVIRKLVVVGVVSAEKSYIECLSVMKEYYRKPLLALTTSSQPIISERDICTIFHSIEELHQVHSTLHEQLESALANWSVKSCVGEFFVQLCQNLKLYKDYVEMYHKSIECLNRNKVENPLFKKFLDDVHMTVTKTSKDIPKINELLRRPVERLQSYSLVLNDLCQHTPIDHMDHRILRDSLKAMSDFITSTHDPQAFRELSGGYNREMVKEGLLVELSEGMRKVRRLFLFHDVLVSAKQKPTRTSIKFEPKWYLPLKELKFKCPSDVAKKPVPVTSEIELSVMKNKVAELRAQVNQYSSRERSSSTSGEGFNIRRNIFMIKYGSNKQSEKIKKKLQEQQVLYWVASPSLPLRLYGNNGKQFMFLLHNEEERENWISAIKKLIPKAGCSVSLTSFELQDLLSRQTINDLRKVEEMIVPTADDDYLSGVLRVRVMTATDLKARTVGLYCCLELDEYGKFERKARTTPTNADNVTLIATWDQDFELELVGSHTMKVQVCSKSLLKEETYAQGKVRLPIKELKQNKRQRLQISLAPQGAITLVIEYFANMASLARKPTLLSSGVFGFPIEVVAKRERHDIPLIVQTCVDEVEKRGLDEVGVYRVAGILRDVQELRLSFDTDYLKAQMIAFETDIHAVAGLLKRYFRELPDPLFTDELYLSFVQALGLSDPEARDQCLLSLLHSLPPVNFKTAVFLLLHLRRVAANSSVNKMTHTNLATIFGPNLVRPGGAGMEINPAAMDVVTPVSVVLYYLNCPEDYFEESQSNRTSPDSTAQGGGSGDRGSAAIEGLIARKSTSSNTALVAADQQRSPGPEDQSALSSGKVFRRSRRASSRGTRTASNSSLRGSASMKNASTSSVSSLTNTAKESVI